MTQQKAVDYLVNLYYTQYNVLLPSEDYAQAKQMEKEQIIDAYSFGYTNGFDDAKLNIKVDDAEQYYNETFISTQRNGNPSAT